MVCQAPNSSLTLLVNQSYASNLSSLNYFTISLHGIVSTMGILENLLILGVLGFCMRRSIISIWILNLAASDLLASAFLPFFTLYMAKGNNWVLGRTFCCVYSSIFFLNMFFSGLLLAAISLDRCLVVLKPVWAQNYRSTALVGKVCAGIWVLALICTVPFFVFRDTIVMPDGRSLCYYNYGLYPPSNLDDLDGVCRRRKEALALFKFFMAFALPLGLIIVSYVAVNSSLARRGCRRPFRFVRLVVAVVVTFILCWAPYHLLFLVGAVAPDGSRALPVVRKALPIAATVGFLNSVLNPVLYVFSCPDLCQRIRHSFGAVMESVLAEDLAEFMRRRSTAHASLTSAEFMLRKKSCDKTNGN